MAIPISPALPTLAISASSSMSNPRLQSANLLEWSLAGAFDPDRPIWIDTSDPNRSISKNQAVKLISSLTGAFDEDSTVCLHLANDILYPILCFAIWASKCKWTGTNPSYRTSELENHLRLSQSKYIITSKEHLETVRAAVQASGLKTNIIIFADLVLAHSNRSVSCAPNKRPRHDSVPDNFITLHDIQRPNSASHLFNVIRDIDSDAIAALFSTSGTSGPPKMAKRTHRALVVESAANQDNNARKPYEVRRLFCTPIFHSFSTSDMILNSLRLGFPAYFMQRFDDHLFANAIQKYGITETFAPPPILLRLIQNVAAHPKLRSLRNVYTGGAPFVPELKAKFDDIFTDGPPRVTQVWGMTEGGWFTTFKYPEVDDTGSVGRPNPGWEVRETDQHIGDYNGIKVSELCVRGPGLMEGYLGNAQATCDAFDRDGWLKTGDVGYIREGKVYLVDRIKDIVKVNGFQVSPSEIENALQLARNWVEDCAVIGVGSDVTERPLAYIVRKHDKVTPEMLKNHLKTLLVNYKVSYCEFEFINTIPKSISGKILKNELRQMAKGQTAMRVS